jgi:hypothetical protein
VSLALGVGSRLAAALGSVRSPLPWRCCGEPFAPSLAFGVGSRCSISSASVGPWPAAFRLSGCWEPPFVPRFEVGVLSSVAVSFDAEEEEPVAPARQLRSELKMLSALPVGELRAQADVLAREIRETDVRIQRANWEIDLLE